MTDKEKIMINGVDVSKCDRLIVNQLYGYVCNCEEDTHIISSCKNRHNCYYKQLARKTTECEELRKQLNAMLESYELNCLSEDSFCKKYPMVKTELNILRKRHKQVLDEIEEHFEHRCKICREEYEFYASCDVCWKKQILDIISKAKGW